MNLQPVKTAADCRLRHPKTKKVLPNVADASAAAVQVDLDDPHWYRALTNGDIVVIKPEAAPAAPAAPAAVAPPVPTAPSAPIAPATTIPAAAADAAAGPGSSATASKTV